MAVVPGPLATTLQRLGRLDPWLFAQLGPPVGEGWFRFDDLAVDAPLSDWVHELAKRHDGHRDVAGSYLGAWLARAALVVPTAALVLQRRLPDPTGPLWVHRHDDGWFDRVAFEDTRLLVTAEDPSASHPDTTVVDAVDLITCHGHALAARLTPVLEGIRALTPFGRRGQWGSVADELASAALWAARSGATDIDVAWRTAVAVTDALCERTPWIRRRPRPFRVDSRHGSTLFSVKATCCLYYKTQPRPPDPSGDSYCTTCLFRDDRSRNDRLLAHLEAGES